MSFLKQGRFDPINAERVGIGIAAVSAGLAVALCSFLGPLVLNIIRYKWSNYSIATVRGLDFYNLIIIVPLLFGGGVMSLYGNHRAKLLLALPGPYLIYNYLLLIITPEYTHPAYENIRGNSLRFYFLFLFIACAGVLLLLYSVRALKGLKTPDYRKGPRNLALAYLVLFSLLLFFVWFMQALNVMGGGDTASASFTRSPHVFLWIRSVDMGIGVPLVLAAVYMFLTRKNSGGLSLMLIMVGFKAVAVPSVFISMISVLLFNPRLIDAGEIIFFTVFSLPCIPLFLFFFLPVLRGKHEIEKQSV
jgi:hypothetical protein